MKPPHSILALLTLGLAAPALAQDDYSHRMHQEHQHETPAASGATEGEPRVPVITEEVVYATFDGVGVKGYLARPKEAAGPLPGLIVIQEWWGLNDNVRAMTRRFAGEGYVALAVDLYEGKLGAVADEARALMEKALGDFPRLMSHLAQARSYLATEAKAPRIGSVGWCFGGAMSLQGAIALGDDLDAAVVYYGRTVSDPAELAKISAPLLGLFGGADTGIPLDGVRAMEAELAKLGKPATVVVYDGAGHGFANPSGQSFDPAAADAAWQRAIAFLAEHLR
jgi:carboxymethylenebutenolidase